MGFLSNSNRCRQPYNAVVSAAFLVLWILGSEFLVEDAVPVEERVSSHVNSSPPTLLAFLKAHL